MCFFKSPSGLGGTAMSRRIKPSRLRIMHISFTVSFWSFALLDQLCLYASGIPGSEVSLRISRSPQSILSKSVTYHWLLTICHGMLLVGCCGSQQPFINPIPRFVPLLLSHMRDNKSYRMSPALRMTAWDHLVSGHETDEWGPSRCKHGVTREMSGGPEWFLLLDIARNS